MSSGLHQQAAFWWVIDCKNGDDHESDEIVEAIVVFARLLEGYGADEFDVDVEVTDGDQDFGEPRIAVTHYGVREGAADYGGIGEGLAEWPFSKRVDVKFESEAYVGGERAVQVDGVAADEFEGDGFRDSWLAVHLRHNLPHPIWMICQTGQDASARTAVDVKEPIDSRIRHLVNVLEGFEPHEPSDSLWRRR